MNNTEKVFSLAFCVHCLGTLKYIRKSHENTKQYIKKHYKRLYSNAWNTHTHTQIRTSTKFCNQHRNDLDYVYQHWCNRTSIRNQTIKILPFLFICCIIFLNSCNHLPVHDPFYVVFLKAVTCWYLRYHTDLHPQHNPTTKTDWKYTHIQTVDTMNSKSNNYILQDAKMETVRTIQATCCSNIFQENYKLATIYSQCRSQMLH